MKRIGIVSAAALSLLLGIAIPALAQDDKPDKQQEDKKEQPVKAEEKRSPEAKPAQQREKRGEEAKPAQQEEKRTQEGKPQQEEKRAQEGKPAQEKTAQREERHNQPAQRGRIPDERFKANFGREHTFRVSQNDYRDRRFQYGGYWFGFAGVWPSNWLYTQDVFVVEINGVYYLCNANYPGVNIELSVAP